MSLSVRPQRRILSTSITRSHSFAGVNSSKEKPCRPLHVVSTHNGPQKSASRVSRMFSMSHKTPAPKVPQPERLDEVYEALKKGLGAYLDVHQLELDKLSTQVRESKRNSRLGFVYDLDKQVKSIERFLRRLEFHASKIDELYESYCIQRRLRDGAHNMVKAYTASPGSKEARESQVEAGKGYKEYTENMCVLESDLENLLGEFHVKMKGLAGFARLCAGDQYEIFMKYGRQRWKLKGRIETNGKQVWDSEEMHFQPLITEFLSIKVTELKSLASHVLVGNVACETKDLFAALPQVVAVDINDLGTIKLSLEVNWNPFDKDDQSSSASAVNKTATVNKRFSMYNQSPPDTPSLREQAFYNMLRRPDDQENSAAWSISSESSDDSSSPQLSLSGRLSQKTIVQPEVQALAPAIEIAFAQPQDPSSTCADQPTQANEIGQEPLVNKELNQEVVTNSHMPYFRTLSHISEVSLEATISDTKEGKVSESAVCCTFQDNMEEPDSSTACRLEGQVELENMVYLHCTAMQTPHSFKYAIESCTREKDVQGNGKIGVPVYVFETEAGGTEFPSKLPIAESQEVALVSERPIFKVEKCTSERQKVTEARHGHSSHTDSSVAGIQELVLSQEPTSGVEATTSGNHAVTAFHKQTYTAGFPREENAEFGVFHEQALTTESPEVVKLNVVISHEQISSVESFVAETPDVMLFHEQHSPVRIPEVEKQTLVESRLPVSPQEAAMIAKQIPVSPNGNVDGLPALTQQATLQVKNEYKKPGTPEHSVAHRPVLAESDGSVASGLPMETAKGRPLDVGLEEAISTLKSSLEDYRGQFPELQTLEQEVKHLEEILMQKQGLFRSRASSISLTVEHALESFDFLNATSDMDDSEYSEDECLERKVSNLRPNTDEIFVAGTSKRIVDDIGVESNSDGSLNPLTTGNEFLDGALVLHLDNCNRLLMHLGTFGPLRCREMYALDKLMRETQIMDIICHLTEGKSKAATKAEDVVKFSTQKEGFLPFWDRCVEHPNIYTTTVERFLHTCKSSYATQINKKEHGLAEPVFVSLAEEVLDRRLPRRTHSRHGGHMTLFQYWSYFESVNVSVLDCCIQEMAEKVLFVQNLNSDDQDVVLKALKGVPESRIQREGLKALSMLLTNGNSKVIAAVSALLKSYTDNLKFRERALVCFLEQLEDEELPIRIAGCAALGCVKAKESIEQLVYLCQTDKEEVRCAAKHTLMLFGEDGKLAYRHLEDSLDGLPQFFAPSVMASTAF
ncbi:rho family-interacting cell polarization regulator 1 isoform X2 [Lissotriton helveticus]